MKALPHINPGHKTCNLPDTRQSPSAGQTAENLPSSLLPGQCDQWSFILMDTPTSIEWTNESSFIFLECKRNFNREEFQKKTFGLACSLEYCAV